MSRIVEEARASLERAHLEASRNGHDVGFIMGARVLIDGVDEAEVRAYWPEGSALRGPAKAYTVRRLLDGESMYVAASRIGVSRKK